MPNKLQLRPALLVVDVQNDFCPGGALAVQDGDAVVSILNEYIERFRNAGLPVYATRDWHPENSQHFQAFGGVWPPHCVQNTPGAEYHPELKLPRDAEIITKGALEHEEGYSAFDGSTDQGALLTEIIKRDRVGHLYVGGLATDYCVRVSVLDARKRGLPVTLLIDAIRAVNVQPDDGEQAIREMRAAGVEIGSLETLDLKLSGSDEEVDT